MNSNDYPCGIKSVANNHYLDTEVQVNISVVNEIMTVFAPMEIYRIMIYDFSGNKICSKDIESNQCSVPLTSLNMNTMGTYIICLETSEGIVSKKVLIK